VDINEVMEQVLALAGHELHENRVLLERQLTKDLPLIMADRVQLQQVLLNLFMNAIETNRFVNALNRGCSVCNRSSTNLGTS